MRLRTSQGYPQVYRYPAEQKFPCLRTAFFTRLAYIALHLCAVCFSKADDMDHIVTPCVHCAYEYENDPNTHGSHIERYHVERDNHVGLCGRV